MSAHCWPREQMTAATIVALSARIDVLTIVVQELGRALARTHAKQVGIAMRQRVADSAAGDLRATADEAVTADLVPLLQALGG